MLKKLLSLSFFILTISGLNAQNDVLEEERPGKLVVLTGVGLQWFDETFKYWTFSLDRPVHPHLHVGIQGNITQNNLQEYNYGTQLKGGFETGVYLKYFFHGKFSGRKSGLFMGPEMRFGHREMVYTQDIFTPLPTTPVKYYYRDKLYKFLLNWGIQWQFNHVVLELSTPFGWESYDSDKNPYGDTGDAYFVMLPTLQMGYSFGGSGK